MGVISLLLTEMLLLLGAFLLGCGLYLGVDPTPYLLYEHGAVQIGFAVAAMIWAFYMLDMYTQVVMESRTFLVSQVIAAMGVTFVAESMVSYLHRDWRLPVHMLVIGCALSAPLLLLWRSIYPRYVFRDVFNRKLVFVGINSLVRTIANHVAEHPELGCTVVGYLSDKPAEEHLGKGKYLGHTDQLKDVVAAVKPDRIIVGMDERRGCTPVADLIDLHYAGYLVEEAASSYEQFCNRLPVLSLRPAQLIFTADLGPRRSSLMLHRLIDILVAGTACLIALPLMALIAVGIKLTSRGPILYRQKRIGLDGKPFAVLKFRSMDDNPANPGEPLTTRFGTFLRNSRLNEVPQLLNVLRGEMSIVGPRPERPEFVRTFVEKIPFYPHRHCIRPGITGWAQVNYLHGDTVADTITKLGYDLYYIKHMSLTLDLFIIFHTLKILLLRRGSG